MVRLQAILELMDMLRGDYSPSSLFIANEHVSERIEIMFRKEDSLDGRKVKVLFDKNTEVETISPNTSIQTINPK